MAATIRIRRAESFGLLHILTSSSPLGIRSSPARLPYPTTPLHPLSTNDHLYRLSRTTELELSSLLARIPRPKERVVALCVEEMSATGLDVVLAINKDTKRRNNGHIERVCAGFQRLFAVLSNLDYNQHRMMTEVKLILDAVAPMSRDPIMAALGLDSGAEASLRRLPVTVTQNVKTSSLPKERAEPFVKAIKGQDMFSTGIDGDGLLTGINGVFRTPGATNLLRDLSPDVLSKEHKCALYNSIKVWCGLVDIAERLWALARETPQIRHMKAVICPPDDTLFRDAAIPAAYQADLDNTLSRLRHHHGLDLDDTQHLARLLARPNPAEPSSLRNRFANFVTVTLFKGTVHAEVQLAAHYTALPPDRKIPRHVAATTGACGQCGSILEFQGMWTGERTKRALSIGWRLPSRPFDLGGEVGGGGGERFTEMVEMQAVRYLRELLSRRGGRGLLEGER